MRAAVLRIGHRWFGYTEVIQLSLVSASQILAKVLKAHPRACWFHRRRARVSVNGRGAVWLDLFCLMLQQLMRQMSIPPRLHNGFEVAAQARGKKWFSGQLLLQSAVYLTE
jgi:hypothetical protein